MTSEAMFKIWNTLDSCETYEQVLTFEDWVTRLGLPQRKICFSLDFVDCFLNYMIRMKKSVLLEGNKMSLYEAIEKDCEPFIKNGFKLK